MGGKSILNVEAAPPTENNPKQPFTQELTYTISISGRLLCNGRVYKIRNKVIHVLRLWDLGLSFWVKPTSLKMITLIIFQSFSLDDDDDGDVVMTMMMVIELLDHPVLCSHRIPSNEFSVWLEYIVLARISQTKQKVSSLGGSEGGSAAFPLLAWKEQCLPPFWHGGDLALLGNRNQIF